MQTDLLDIWDLEREYLSDQFEDVSGNGKSQAKDIEFSAKFHSKQKEFFFNDRDIRYKILPKGRRWGFTRGAMQYLITAMHGRIDGENLPPKTRCLWVDTINSNIDRYVNRYAMPVLQKVPNSMWHWGKQAKQLTLINWEGKESICDFRSAEQPERLEGFGYNLIIINEAGIVLKDVYLWENAILPMTMDYKSPMIIGGTPKGKRDKKRMKERGEEYAIFYELAERGTEGSELYNPDYKTYRYTSYDNPKISKDEVDNLAKTLPSISRDQEIFAKFVDDIAGDVFRSEWWQNWYQDPTPDLLHAKLPPREDFVRIIQSWDTAFGNKEENDFSVGTTWGQTKNGIYLLDMYRERALYPDLKKALVMLYNLWKPEAVLIEDKASGISILQDLERETTLPLVPIKVDRDKVSRATANTPYIEAGNVWIPDVTEHKWAKDFREEHNGFPNTEFDDIVDSTSQALTYLRSKPTANYDNIKVSGAGMRRGDNRLAETEEQ